MFVLDCTFRDGGYKTDWRFNAVQVMRHIAGTAADVIEIGYRAAYRHKLEHGRGAYRYCLDSYIDALQVPERVRLAVMVNANEWRDDLFRPKAESRIDIVRVAAHLESIGESEDIVRRLRDIGYFVTLNIMQAHRARDSVFDREYGADVVYFADSFGCMSARQVARIVDKLKRHNQVGFHGHNNTGRALSNTLTAMRHGATWLDASVGGIGRCAGNTDLADLLSSLGRSGGVDLVDLGQEHTIRSRIVYGCWAMLKRHPKRIEQWA
jgi:4-hydroxy 2-oxovalerate aldolase